MSPTSPTNTPSSSPISTASPTKTPSTSPIATTVLPHKEWTCTQDGSKCFLLLDPVQDWDDYESTCLLYGGQPASIHSEEENQLVSNLARFESKLLGAKPALTNPPSFVWSDGSEWDYEPASSSTGNNKDYLAMLGSGIWYEMSVAFHLQHAVCQRASSRFEARENGWCLTSDG